jgi:hypothetical protein
MFLEDIYNFFGDIEAIAYDFTKSLLIDCETMRYLPSLVVCAVISTTIEIYQRVHLTEKALASNPRARIVLYEMWLCNKVWDSLVQEFFGKKCLTNISHFGRYLILRQQKLYRLFKVQRIHQLSSIFKERTTKYYDHRFFDSPLSTVQEDPN